MSSLTRLTAIATLTTLLSGCGAVIVGGVTTGAVVAHDRRSTGTVVQDQEIELQAVKIKDQHTRDNSNIAATSYNLKVLLTGQASSADISARYAQQVSGINRVEQVYNEVEIGAPSTWSDAATDTYLTTRVKIALFDIGLEGFDPTRVKVKTSKSTVYLMGLVTRQESEAVTEKVRHMSGVQKVVRLFEYIQP